MKANAGDVFCVFNKRLEKYTACQITKLFFEKEKELAVLLVLDWTGDKILEQNELRDLKPLAMNFMLWDMEKYLLNVGPDVPKDYIYIGNTQPLTYESTNSYSDWENGYSIYRQMKWNEFPEEKRLSFKKAMKTSDDIKVNINGQSVCINTRILYDVKYDFESAKELFALPCLYELNLVKWHSDLYEYLESTPFICNLDLKGHNQKILDFRKSHLIKLNIEVTGVDEIFLNDDIEELYLSGEFNNNIKIHAKNEGNELIAGFKKTINLNFGCKKLSKIQCIGTDEVDISQIAAAYPDLTSIRLWGKPGYIRNFNEIKLLKQLCTFTSVDMFGFSANDIPKPEEMPHLSWFWMSSLPEDAAKEAKRLYKKEMKNGLDLWIQKARKPEWLAENLENPFRSWDGQGNISALMAKKAATQYKKTRSEITDLISSPTEAFDENLNTTVKKYTQAFNKMNNALGFIETEEREDVYLALCGLIDLIADDLKIDKKAVFELFDNIRDF